MAAFLKCILGSFCVRMQCTAVMYTDNRHITFTKHIYGKSALITTQELQTAPAS